MSSEGPPQRNEPQRSTPVVVSNDPPGYRYVISGRQDELTREDLLRLADPLAPLRPAPAPRYRGALTASFIRFIENNSRQRPSSSEMLAYMESVIRTHSTSRTQAPVETEENKKRKPEEGEQAAKRMKR